MPMGPKERRSTVLSPMEEVAIVALRVQARLPLDDVFIALKDVIPHLPSRNSGNQSPRSLTSSLTITRWDQRSEEHTSELQSLMRITYAVICLKKKKQHHT